MKREGRKPLDPVEVDRVQSSSSWSLQEDLTSRAVQVFLNDEEDRCAFVFRRGGRSYSAPNGRAVLQRMRKERDAKYELPRFADILAENGPIDQACEAARQEWATVSFNAVERSLRQNPKRVFSDRRYLWEVLGGVWLALESEVGPCTLRVNDDTQIIAVHHHGTVEVERILRLESARLLAGKGRLAVSFDFAIRPPHET